jgi:hypothetical protein
MHNHYYVMTDLHCHYYKQGNLGKTVFATT